MPVATQRGGAEMTLLQVLEHSHDVRWLVVFLEDGPMVSRAAELGCEVAVIEAGRLRDVGQTIRVARRLGTLLHGWRADVVVSWMSKAHLYAAPPARLLGLPAVWFQHGLPSATDPIDRLAVLAPAREILAPSRTVANAQAQIRPRRPTRVVHPGVDLDALARRRHPARDAVLARAGVPAGAIAVGLVGRLQRWKGPHALIQALPRLQTIHRDAHVVLVGGDHPLEPGYRDELIRLAQSLELTDRIHFAGHQADPLSWMESFDVVVHHSDNEPFGLVVLEAMALGRPLVAGARGGPSEVVRDGVDGFLVEYEDVPALAERVGRLLGDRALADRMGAAAAARARDFSAPRFASGVVAVLRSHAPGRPYNARAMGPK